MKIGEEVLQSMKNALKETGHSAVRIEIKELIEIGDRFVSSYIKNMQG